MTKSSAGTMEYMCINKFLQCDDNCSHDMLSVRKRGNNLYGVSKSETMCDKEPFLLRDCFALQQHGCIGKMISSHAAHDGQYKVEEFDKTAGSQLSMCDC